MTAFHKTYFDILETIDDCVSKDRITPALILLYSAIDSFSDLSNRKEKGGRQTFKDWVKTYMLEKYPLPCNEEDIYAARCALLHTNTSESDLSKKSEAMELYYVHGQKPIEPLEQAIQNVQETQGRVIAVRVEDMIRSFRNGMADCMALIGSDPKWTSEFNSKVEKYLTVV